MGIEEKFLNVKPPKNIVEATDAEDEILFKEEEVKEEDSDSRTLMELLAGEGEGEGEGEGDMEKKECDVCVKEFDAEGGCDKLIKDIIGMMEKKKSGEKDNM